MSTDFSWLMTFERGGAVARPILHVRYPGCIIPDPMRYDAPEIEVEVGAEGKLQSKDVMSATKIFAKCPGKYSQADESWGGRITPVPPCR